MAQRASSKLLCIFVTAAVLLLLRAGPAGAADYELSGGRLFDGSAFVAGTIYVIDGKIRRSWSGPVDERIELSSGYVVPGYGDAHLHGFRRVEETQQALDQLTRQGVQYVAVMDTLGAPSDTARALHRAPGTPDLIYTYGVITGRRSGHAVMFGQMAEEGRVPGATSKEDLNGLIFNFVDSEADIEAFWPGYAASGVDFMKIVIQFTEEYDRRRADDAFLGQTSVPPGLVAPLVERAHAAGKRMAVHIETAADFRLAIDAGADIVAHLPASWIIREGPGPMATGFKDGSLDHFKLSAEDARAAADAGTLVITTTVAEKDHPDYAKFAEVAAHNLRLLFDAGTRVILGGDGGRITDEARHVAELSGIEADRVLDLLTRATPQAIFPGRKIGLLQDGYEANLLVLGGNPLSDLGHLDDVIMSVKDGVLHRFDGAEASDR